MKKVLALLCAAAFALSLSVVASAADPEIAKGKTAISSGSKLAKNDGTTYDADNAFDGDNKTSWRTPDGQDNNKDDSPALNEDGTFKDDIYLGVDLGSKYAISKVELDFSVDRPAGDETGWKVQVSDDGKSWSDVSDAKYSFATFTAAWDEIDDHTVDSVTFSAEARYVRVLFLKPCIEQKANQTVYEMKVYGTPAANAGDDDNKPADTDKPADKPADTDKPADKPADTNKPANTGVADVLVWVALFGAAAAVVVTAKKVKA